MKMYLLTIIMTLSTSVFAQSANKTKIIKTKDSDKTEIIKVLKAETTAFYANDYERWKAEWIKDENSVVAYNNVDGSYAHMRGWVEINKVFEKMIRERTEEAHPDFNVGDLYIEINGSMALVLYNEYVANSENKFSKVPGFKTLKKENGSWKLHSVISFWDRNYQYSEDQVNEFVKNSGF